MENSPEVKPPPASPTDNFVPGLFQSWLWRPWRNRDEPPFGLEIRRGHSGQSPGQGA